MRDNCAGGHIKPDPYWHASQVAAEHGPVAAAELANFELENLKAVKQHIEKEGIDCDFVVTRACDVVFSREQGESARQALRQMQDMGVAAAQDAYAVPEQYAETVCSESYFICGFLLKLIRRYQASRERVDVFLLLRRIYGRIN
jgi:hypothetical protein